MENQKPGTPGHAGPSADETYEPEFFYQPHGVCSRAIKFDIADEGKVRNTRFFGGCNGNLKGISSLIEGMPVDWVIERCEGTQCGGKSTSCPDQLARALKFAQEERAKYCQRQMTLRR